MWTFPDDVAGIEAAIFRNLDEARAERDGDFYAGAAFAGLVFRRSKLGAAAADPAFGERLAGALPAARESVRHFLIRTAVMADTATSDRWYELCVRRSAIDLALAEVAGTAARELFAEIDLGEVDEALAEWAEDFRPLDPADIPPGLPREHWWWWSAPPAELRSGG